MPQNVFSRKTSR